MEASSDKDDGECGKENELLMYNETFEYLFNGCYPPDATIAENGVIRKRAKNFRIIDGVLHYKGKNGPRQVCVCSIILSYIRMNVCCCIFSYSMLQSIDSIAHGKGLETFFTPLCVLHRM